MGHRVFALAATLALAAAAPDSYAQRGWHSDSRFGFKFKPPRKWDQIPLKRNEGWLVAKYLSDKSYFYTDPNGGWTWEHKPELMVIAFVEKIVEEGGEDEKEGEDEGPDEEGIVEIADDPYEDYEDYLDRTYTGGGFHIAELEQDEEDGIPVTKYQIKVEKLATTGPKRIVCWLFDGPGVDFAVQVEVLEDEYRKLRRTIRSFLRSFELIERTEGALPGAASTRSGLGVYISVRDMTEGTPAEREDKRREAERREHEKAIAGLADDWSHALVDDILVLSRSQGRHAKRVAENLAALMDWLDETFPHVGPDEYVRRPILRMCDDSEEERAFARGHRAGGSAWYPLGLEIVTHDDKEGFLESWEVNWSNGRLLDHWFRERDRDLYDAMPMWLSSGMREYVEGARVKGRRMEFRDDGWSRDDLRLLVHQGKAMRPRELMKLTREEFWGSGNVVFDRMAEAQGLVRFMLSEEGQRNRLVRDTLSAYIQNLEAAVDEMAEKDDELKLGAKPTSEAEEEELFRKRREAWQKREKALIDDVFFRTFKSWSERDWERFEKEYFDYVG